MAIGIETQSQKLFEWKFNDIHDLWVFLKVI